MTGNDMDQDELISNCSVRLEALERQMALLEAKHRQVADILKSHNQNQGKLVFYLKKTVKTLIERVRTGV